MRVQEPYHEGDLPVQERLNEREIGKHNGRSISDSIIQGALKYIEHQPLATLAGITLFVTVAASPTFAGDAPTEQASQKAIDWSTDLPAALKKSAQTGKPVLAGFHAVWCPVCRRMLRETTPSPKIQGLADRFHWVSIDVDRQVTTARQYHVRGTPEILIFDSSGTLRSRYLGFFSANDLRSHLLESLDGLAKQSSPQADALLYDLTADERTNLTYTPNGYRGDSICFSHVGYGPLHLVSQSPLQSLRLSLTPRTPSTLARGQTEVRWNETWATIWAPGGDYSLDYETLNTNFSVAYGVLDTVEVELQFWDWSRFGGKMDRFTQNFHRLFGIGQNGRTDVPRGDFTIDFGATASDPAVTLTPDDRGTFSRSVALSVQHNVTCGTAKLPALSYALTARHNVKAVDIRDGDDFDFAASIAVARRLGNFYGYFSLGHTWYGDETFRGIRLRSRQLSALTVLEWRYLPRQSFLIQYLVSEGVAEDRSDFSKSSNEVTLGWKGELRANLVLELGIIENVITYDNSPDFGVFGGLAYRF